MAECINCYSETGSNDEFCSLECEDLYNGHSGETE